MKNCRYKSRTDGHLSSIPKNSELPVMLLDFAVVAVVSSDMKCVNIMVTAVSFFHP